MRTTTATDITRRTTKPIANGRRCGLYSTRTFVRSTGVAGDSGGVTGVSSEWPQREQNRAPLPLRLSQAWQTRMTSSTECPQRRHAGCPAGTAVRHFGHAVSVAIEHPVSR
ncbi:hypothetical protein [Acrocarpospora sp. B8E8]|uniref:hypothetical protein n=1 Tax=Acrocarpospora sp. B8E8 TaxID=3153572 RepID=UPI00325FC3B0